MSRSSFGWTAHAPLSAQPMRPADEDVRPELADVGRLVRRGVRGLVGVARAGERTTLADILLEHLQTPVEELSVVEERWASYEHVNVQAALDAWLGGRPHQEVGIVGFQHQQFGIGDLLEQVDLKHNPFGPRPGNVARTNLPVGPDGRTASCVRCAVYLLHEPAEDDDDGAASVPVAVLLRGADPEYGQPNVAVEIAAPDAATAARAARTVRRLAVEHNVFRGQVLSFGQEMFGPGGTLLQFHERPTVGADQVILPAEAAEAVHRQVVEVARHKERLLRAGQHLKRGVLLYGPPGVGKTHTVRHLVSSLTETTVIQLTGDALHLISEACSVARALQPAMVVVEDVDLIAEDRGMHPGQHPLLFQLLGEMDGLAEDTDVVFVLTTNRADLLEPALAARPGRVDQAVELPLPDAAARRQLFALYKRGLEVDEANLDSVIERTEGVTASFIKELLRRAALLAATREGGEGDGAAAAGDGDGAATGREPLRVSAADLDAAVDELLDTRNDMTRVLLGTAPSE